MKLNLTVSGKILASTSIDPNLITDVEYLKAVRRLLMLRYQKKLLNCHQAPAFSVEQPVAKN